MAGAYGWRAGALALCVAAMCAIVLLYSQSQGMGDRPRLRPAEDAVQNTLTREELLTQIAEDRYETLVLMMKESPDFAIARVPTPLLKETAVYRVLASGSPRILVDPPMGVDRLFVKTSDGQVRPHYPQVPREWRKVVRREGICVNTPGEAAELFRIYSLPLGTDFYRVEGVQDIDLFSGHGLKELGGGTRADLAKGLQPPAFRRKGRDFESDFYALRTAKGGATDLVRGVCTVDGKGMVSIEWKEVIAEGILGIEIEWAHYDMLMGLKEAKRYPRAAGTGAGKG